MEHSIGSSSDPNLAVYELQVYLIRLARYEHALEDSPPCLSQSKMASSRIIHEHEHSALRLYTMSDDNRHQGTIEEKQWRIQYLPCKLTVCSRSGPWKNINPGFENFYSNEILAQGSSFSEF